jgi:hypothetical protein
MKRMAIPLTLAVTFCFLLVSTAQADPSDPVNKGFINKRVKNAHRAVSIPNWQITQDGTAFSVNWVDHAPNPRFAICDCGTPANQNDDAVLDKETGLVWERRPNNNGSTAQWHGALSWANGYERCRRYGWRLPTLEELLSLGFDGVAEALPPDHPFIDVSLDYYWTSTTYVQDSSQALAVEFNGYPGFIPSFKTLPYNVWSVRGGSGDAMFGAPLPLP